MGKAFQCDRCGSIHEGTRAGHVKHRGSLQTTFSGELCEACQDELLDWWEDDHA